MSKPEFVYVIYIASTPEKVFQALTDEKMSEQYWVGNRVVSDAASFRLEALAVGPLGDYAIGLPREVLPWSLKG